MSKSILATVPAIVAAIAKVAKPVLFDSHVKAFKAFKPANIIHGVNTEIANATKAKGLPVDNLKETTKVETARRVAKGKPAKVAKVEAPKEKTSFTPKTLAALPVIVEAPSLKYAIVDYCRPKAGASLFAHTQAFFELSGMQEGKAYPKAKALQVIGNTAIKYHTGNGNLETTKDGLVITGKGVAFFAARGINKELKDAFTSVLSTGELNDKAYVKAVSSRVLIK